MTQFKNISDIGAQTGPQGVFKFMPSPVTGFSGSRNQNLLFPHAARRSFHFNMVVPRPPLALPVDLARSSPACACASAWSRQVTFPCKKSIFRSESPENSLFGRPRIDFLAGILRKTRQKSAQSRSRGPADGHFVVVPEGLPQGGRVPTLCPCPFFGGGGP